MKYEIIFGDERLFDGASEFVEVIRFNDYSRDYLWGDLNTIQLLTFEELKAIPIVAMRRIIADPKLWTVADQQAGRDPKVGDHCFSDYDEQPARIIAKDVDDDFWFKCDNGYVRCTDRYKISPLEMPEEKEKRLEEEFVTKNFEAEANLSAQEKQLIKIGMRIAYRAMNKPNEQS